MRGTGGVWGGGGGVCADTTQCYIRALGIGRFPHGELSRIPKDNCAIFLPDGLEVELEGRAGTGRGASRMSFLRQTPETRKDVSLLLKDQ